MHKDVFVDRHKQSDLVKDYKNFLTKMEELKSYVVEFEENSIMKPKTYLFDYAVLGGDKDQSIIVIIYDEYIFSANNGV